MKETFGGSLYMEESLVDKVHVLLLYQDIDSRNESARTFHSKGGLYPLEILRHF